jgi:predicted dehydrogenase
MVGYTFNLTPVAKRVQQILKSGELGNIQYLNGIYNSFMTPFFSGHFPFQPRVHQPTQYQDPQQLGGGHAQVQLTHLAGLVFFLSKLELEQVSALMTKQQFPIDLVNAMSVAFAGGALGTFGGTGNQHGITFRLVINCEKGWIDMDGALHQATIHRPDTDVERLSYQPEGFLGHITSHHFVDLLLGKVQDPTSAESGVRAVELLEAAYRSAAQHGNVIKVKELYENN